jgi:hypothetical protein
MVFFKAMILKPASSIILIIAPVFDALTASGFNIVNVLFPAIIIFQF